MDQARASDKDNVFGNIWSDNIGWISLNSCENPLDVNTCGQYDYGVNIDDKSTMEVSGTAWSDNVGWISFNPSEWGSGSTNCPPGTGGSCSTFKNKWGSGGWARAVNGIGGNGGYDGWISLDGSGYGATFDITKNVSASMPIEYQNDYVYTISTSDNGHWWGSEAIGWIDLNHASSYQPKDGGAFLLDLSTETLDLTAPSINKNTVVAGDTVDIDWETTGITPTSCTGTVLDDQGNPLTPTRTDWETTFNTGVKTKGTITGIEVPFDDNNKNDTNTQFILSCTNGVKTVDSSIWIKSIPMTVFMKNGGGSCVSGSTALLDWDTNDTTADCQIDGDPAPGGSGPYTIKSFTGTPPSQASDPDFSANKGNGSTKYTLSCTNNTSGVYQNPLTVKTSGTVAVNQCVTDFKLSYAPSCEPFVVNGTGYDATVEFTINPQFGFNNDVDFSDGGGIGTWSFSPSQSTFGSLGFSKVSATLSLTGAEYDAIKWNLPFTRDVLLDALGFSQKVEPIEFCESGTKKTRPKYIPF